MANTLLTKDQIKAAVQAKASAQKSGRTVSAPAQQGPAVQSSRILAKGSVSGALLSGEQLRAAIREKAEAVRKAGQAIHNQTAYYSRPSFGGQAESLYDAVKVAENTRNQRMPEVEAAQETLLTAENRVSVLTKNLELLKNAWEQNPDARNKNRYAMALKILSDRNREYNNAYSAYERAYNAAYGDYEKAVGDYNRYLQEQETQFNDWKGTIRGMEEIRVELDAVNARIAEQKQKEQSARATVTTKGSYLAAAPDAQASPYAANLSGGKAADNTVSPELQALLDKQAILQEEYDWSEYYRYADLVKNADFAEKSRYVSTANGTPIYDMFGGAYLNPGFDDPTYDYINQNQLAVMRQGIADQRSGAAVLGMDRSQLQEMSDDEISIFNYLYATEGKDEAYRYVTYLNSDLTKRQRQNTEASAASFAQEHPVAASAMSILGSPMKSISYLGQAADYLTDGKIDENAGYNKYSYANNAIRNQVADTIAQSGKWGEVGSFLYQTGMSMGDFLLTTGITGGSQALSLAIMGTSAAADTTIAAKDRGLDDNQAFALGTVAGLAEVATEKVSLEALLNPKWLKDGSLKYILKNMLAEAGEEVSSSLINLTADVLISQDRSQWQQSMDAYKAQGLSEKEAFGQAFKDQMIALGLDALGGALSGGVLSGGNAAINHRSTGKTAEVMQEVQLDEGGLRDLIESGLESAPDTESYQLARELQKKQEEGKEITAFEQSRLLQANAQAMAQEQAAEQEEKDNTRQEEQTGQEDTGSSFWDTARQQVMDNVMGRNSRDGESQSVTVKEGAQVGRETIHQAQRLVKATGRQIVFYSTPATDAGIENGYFQNGIIYVNTRSENPLAQIFSHELTHSVEMADAYQELSMLVKERIESAGGDMEQLRREKAEMYARNGVQLKNKEDIDSEIIASYVEQYLLTDEESIIQLTTENPGLGRKILNWIDRMFAKLGDAKAQERTFLTQARMCYARALEQTTRNSSAQSETAQAKNRDSENGDMSMEEMKAWADEELRAGRWTDEEYDAFLDEYYAYEEQNGIDGMAKENARYLPEKDTTETKHSISSTYASEIEEWDSAGRPEGETFILGSTGDVLQALGAVESDIYMLGDKIQKIQEDHPEITLEEIKRIPQILEDPILILNSRNAQRMGVRNTRMLLFGSVRTQNGLPVLTVLDLKPNMRDLQIAGLQKVTSAYTKDQEAEWFVSNSEVLYADKNRTAKLLRSIGFTMPIELQQSGYIGSISYSGRSVNMQGVPFAEIVAGRDQNANRKTSISSQSVNKLDVVKDLREILSRGGDPTELSKYVRSLEQRKASTPRLGNEDTVFAEDYRVGDKEQTETKYSLSDKKRPDVQKPLSETDVKVVQNIGRKSVNDFTDADIQATERFAQQYWQEMGVKSPFFRAWFGDWRTNDKTPVHIANQQGDTRGVQKNEDTGWEIQVSGKVFNETRVHTDSYNIAARPYLPYINDIVKKAVLLDSHGVGIGKAKSSNSLLMHSMYAVADIGDGPELLKLYVEEMNNPNTVETGKRAYQLQAIEKYQPTGKSSQKTASSISPVATGNVNSVADLFGAVKQYDKNFQPKDTSKAVNEDGTPKIYYHGTNADWYAYDLSKNVNQMWGDGIYLAESAERAKAYGDRVIPLYVQALYNNRDAKRIGTTRDHIKMSNGDLLVFSPKQIKSATNNIGTFDGGNPDIRYSLSDAKEAADVEPLNREELPAKARNYLEGTERKLLRGMKEKMGVSKFANREYLQDIVREISDEYLRTGTVADDKIDFLFDKAYAEGIVSDGEFYKQYKDIKDHLRKTAVTISEQDKSDIADFEDFRRRAWGTLKIVNKDGLSVDSAYQELTEMAPNLFPETITHPADQLVRMYEVGHSIRVSEKSLNEYYGEGADDFRSWAKNDFRAAIGDVMSDLHQVKRYADAKAAVGAESQAPVTPEEAAEAWKELKQARKTYEKAAAKNLLTPHDEVQVGRLLRGEIAPEHLDPDKDNVKGITAIFEAKQEYERLTKLLAEYKRHRRAERQGKADAYLETANEWEDKRIGLAYSRETMRRNVFDIIPDAELAEKINEEYFEKVHDSEAASTRFKTRYRDRIREMNLSISVSRGNLVSEAHAVQLVGEAMDNIRMLENARGRIKTRDGKTLQEWRDVVNNLWIENPGLDKTKIEKAVQQFREIYDDLFQQMNRVRVENGYEPVNYRQGYFPHFQPGDGDGILAHFGKAMGIDTQVAALPTTINGLTHTFKPGIQWFGNAQERLGFNTAYDAVEGFDKYIEGVSSVIHHTDNIQNLRALATQIRYRTSDEGIRQQVDAVNADTRLTEEERQMKIRDIYEHGKYTLSNFVNELDEYTNLLANKKSKFDRTMEAMMGRRAYMIMKAWESRVGANMIAGNLSSALTNFIPLTQAGAQLDRGSLLKGMWGTLKAYKSDDGIVGMSSFLTNRRGSDPLIRTWVEKTSGVLGMPMELIDGFVSDSIVRAAYYQNLSRGMSEAESMHQADIFASGVMADRSKGAMPTLFEATNPVFKAFTQFQLEVNNQFSEVFKDLPRGFKEKGLAALALVLLKYFLGAFLFNEVYEYFFGRRSALDPFGILNETVGDLTGYELPNLLELAEGAANGEMPSFDTEQVGIGGAVENLAGNLLSELPFASGLTLLGIETDGGRIPVSSAIPDLSALWDAATEEGWSAEKRWKEAQDELNKLSYIIPPFGGNQISKIWKGIKAYKEGGSYSVDAEGNDILQYPIFKDNDPGDFWTLVRAMIMGKSSLPESQDWVEDGFDSLSAKETALYRDLMGVGVSDRDAYSILDALRDAEETELYSKKEVQKDLLLSSDISGEGKAILYYGLLASDTEKKRMDELADAGVNQEQVFSVTLGLSDAEKLTGAEKREAQAEVIVDSSMTGEEKKFAMQYILGDEMTTETGAPSQYAKFLTAIDSGLSVDKYMALRNEGVQIDEYFELKDVGLGAGQAAELAAALNRLEPEDGTDSVSREQRYSVILNAGLSEEKQMAVLATVMPETEYSRMKTGYGFGVFPDAYIQFKNALPDFDENGNGSYTQEEVTAAIDAIAGDGSLYALLTGQGTGGISLTDEQKAVLWQIQNKSWKPYRNPYDTNVGEMVYNALNAE